MAKLIELLSLVCLLILLIGCLFIPASSMFWLASSQPIYMYLRLSLICLMALLLFVGVPNNMRFRFMLGLGGVSLTLWAGVKTYGETLAYLDGLALLAAGFSFMLMALEPAKVKVEVPEVKDSLVSNTELALFRLKRRALPYALASILLMSIFTPTRLKDSVNHLLT